MILKLAMFNLLMVINLVSLYIYLESIANKSKSAKSSRPMSAKTNVVSQSININN